MNLKVEFENNGFGIMLGIISIVLAIPSLFALWLYWKDKKRTALLLQIKEISKNLFEDDFLEELNSDVLKIKYLKDLFFQRTLFYKINKSLPWIINVDNKIYSAQTKNLLNSPMEKGISLNIDRDVSNDSKNKMTISFTRDYFDIDYANENWELKRGKTPAIIIKVELPSGKTTTSKNLINTFFNSKNLELYKVNGVNKDHGSISAAFPEFKTDDVKIVLHPKQIKYIRHLLSKYNNAVPKGQNIKDYFSGIEVLPLLFFNLKKNNQKNLSQNVIRLKCSFKHLALIHDDFMKKDFFVYKSKLNVYRNFKIVLLKLSAKKYNVKLDVREPK